MYDGRYSCVLPQRERNDLGVLVQLQLQPAPGAMSLVATLKRNRPDLPSLKVRVLTFSIPRNSAMTVASGRCG